MTYVIIYLYLPESFIAYYIMYMYGVIFYINDNIQNKTGNLSFLSLFFPLPAMLYSPLQGITKLTMILNVSKHTHPIILPFPGYCGKHFKPQNKLEVPLNYTYLVSILWLKLYFN